MTKEIEWQGKWIRAHHRYCDGVRSYDRSWHVVIWNVKMHAAPTFQQVLDEMAKHHYVNKAEMLTRIPDMDALRVMWNREYEEWYETSLGNMRGQFTGKDMACYKTISPAVAKRWHLAYPKESWDVKYQFSGRGGGWLTMTNFEGYNLMEIGRSFTGVVEFARQFDNATLKKMCCMMEEIFLAVAKREEELLYRLAFNMRYNMPTVVPE